MEIDLSKYENIETRSISAVYLTNIRNDISDILNNISNEGKTLLTVQYSTSLSSGSGYAEAYHYCILVFADKIQTQRTLNETIQ